MRLRVGATWGLAIALLVGVLAGCGYRGPPSDHFDGRRFTNVPAVEEPGLRELVKWGRTRRQGGWRKWVDAPPGSPPPGRVRCEDMRVTFINHSTVLVQAGGLNVLTDPVYSERVSPVRGVGPRRHRPPGIRFEDLPPIDVVVVSHSHYDHLDIPTLRRLAGEHRPRIFVGLGNDRLLRRKRVAGAEAVDWWQAVPLSSDVTLHGVPMQHWSLRGLADRNRTLWLGYVLETRCGRVFISGDTGFGPHFEAIAERFAPFRLALLPIGAYRPRWFMQPSHIDPEQAVAASRILEAQTSVAMHFGTFALGDDGETEPPQELTRWLRGEERARFWVLEHGEGRAVPP